MADPRGPEIEAMRKRRGWKRSEFAMRLGISFKHVYGMERGFNTASEELLHRVANELGVDIAEVMKAPPRESNPTKGPEPTHPVPPPRKTKSPQKHGEAA